MSAGAVRYQINKVQSAMKGSESSHLRYGDRVRTVTEHFLHDISVLHEKYGEFVGKAKASHPEYLQRISEMSKVVREYYEHLTETPQSDYCFKLVGLVIGKISETLTFVEGLEAQPPEKKVSRSAYEKLVREKDDLRRTIEIMVKYKGLPELNELLETARKVKLPTDIHWVLALCSVNLIEAVVNKKLVELGLPTKGNFENRYKRLVSAIREKELREIQQLLPLALYNVIRNKLDHASHVNKVTSKEAKDISKIVINLIEEINTHLTNG